MKTKIIDIIGHCIEPERAELQAEEIMNLYNDSYSELLEALQELHHASWEKGCSAQLSEELKKAKKIIKKITK